MDFDNRLMDVDMFTYSPDDPPESPQGELTMAAYARDSLNAILRDIVGTYVSVEFLIGTSGIVVKSGFLVSAGVNFIVIKNPEYPIYTICDFYSIKFVNVYSTKTGTFPLPEFDPIPPQIIRQFLANSSSMPYSAPYVPMHNQNAPMPNMQMPNMQNQAAPMQNQAPPMQNQAYPRQGYANPQFGYMPPR